MSHYKHWRQRLVLGLSQVLMHSFPIDDVTHIHTPIGSEQGLSKDFNLKPLLHDMSLTKMSRV
jgi:hypothetical protein